MVQIVYVLIALALVLGWLHAYPVVLIPMAALSTLCLSEARKRSIKTDRSQQNSLSELLYLFVLQLLILFVAMSLGYFLSTAITSVPGF